MNTKREKAPKPHGKTFGIFSFCGVCEEVNLDGDIWCYTMYDTRSSSATPVATHSLHILVLPATIFLPSVSGATWNIWKRFSLSDTRTSNGQELI